MVVAPPGKKFKPLAVARSSNVPLVGRTRFMAHLQRAAVELAPDSKFPKLSAFFNKNVWPWIWNYLKGIFRRKFRPYPKYSSTDTGIYAIRAADGGAEIKLSIVGDWGTGTGESYEVACRIGEFQPDYTLHLGDIYYVGGDTEVRENFLGVKVPGDVYTPVKFPRGKVGTLSIPGNHEMYGGGAPYFTEIIGPQGYCETGTGGKQATSYFCLESEQWRVVGIDTGYNSVGVPILGSIPFINRIPLFSADCKLEDNLIEWLRSNVKPQSNKKATLLLGHHQYYSVYEAAYPRPAKQLKEFFGDQNVVWIWGHEHRLSIYDLHSPDKNINCYGRCLGNGGMPVELEKTGKKKPLLFQDPRGLSEATQYQVGDGTFAGWNGHVNVVLAGAVMTLKYYDLNGRELFSESFTSDGIGNVMQTTLSNPVLQPPA